TAKALVLKPGFLSKEFKIGRRAAYVPPVRLYVFISFVFFLVLSLTSGKHEDEGSKAAGETTNTLNMSFAKIPSSELAGLSDPQIDSVLRAHDMEPGFWNHYLARQVARMAASGRSEVNHMLIKGVSYMMFALMPLFGLMLFLFYRKTGEYYINCLVFSVHFHSFVFLLLTLDLLLGKFVDFFYLIAASILGVAVYLWLALKTTYAQRLFRTTLKTLTIGFIHLISIILSFMMMIFIGVLLF
ncbi:MAG: DUF3667 domain-containing protein, partial [Candidatus Zixiibacteriota bacterium]